MSELGYITLVVYSAVKAYSDWISNSHFRVMQDQLPEELENRNIPHGSSAFLMETMI